MPFNPDYIRLVLNENFEDAKTLFVEPLMAIHYAHLAMLAEHGIVSRDDARAIRTALDAVDPVDIKRAAFDGTSEDMFFFVNRLIAVSCGADVAGRLHTARSRNDVDMTLYRLRLRGWVLDLADAVVALRSALLDTASRHRESLFPAHTHTQPAQPTTIAHYVLAVVEGLERDSRRLAAAYETTNRNPLGACAITGTGFPIDRERTSALLGFSGPTGNTYGSIATVDYLVESAGAAATHLVGLGRFVQDLLLWSTTEVGYIRLSDAFVQVSSIMPQKRNPVALEHARALSSKALAELTAIGQTVHNTPFGDVVDSEDDLQPLVALAFRDALRATSLVAITLEGIEFDVARMRARAAEGWVTVTELADALVRDHGLSFGRAHEIVSRFVRLPADTRGEGHAARLSGVASEVGHDVRYSDADLNRILSPEHFVTVRRTHGGPAPEIVARAIDVSRAQLAADVAALAGAKAALTNADIARRQAVDAL